MENTVRMPEARLALLRAFPGSFFNKQDEFIAHPPTNQYFIFASCQTVADVQCKVLEWLSRAAYKATPYHHEHQNEKLHQFMLDGINAFLGTAFSSDDIAVVYQALGNAVQHDLTMGFVVHKYSIEWLKETIKWKD